VTESSATHRARRERVGKFLSMLLPLYIHVYVSLTAYMLYLSEFLAADPDVPGSISGTGICVIITY
jgi:hypothetical protein